MAKRKGSRRTGGGRKKTVKVASTRHKDKRKNIPTEELRGFVAEEEQRPQEVEYPGLLYARDPSLDPQLVWKGKDDQDREDLTVPAVPVYIQEKIHPQAIVEDVREQARKDQPQAQLDLFADFNGLPDEFDQRVDFYHHEANWSNRMILGDSLLVMTSLAEKEGLKGQVQMIYIDPPYGIKFGSNWQVSTRKRDVKDGKAGDLTRQPEQIRAFRDTWELGIHSYLAYWRDRLIAARELLTETGSIFVQIGDENVHLVRCMMDEVFGSDNFCSQICFQKSGKSATSTIPAVMDYYLWYATQRKAVKVRSLFRSKADIHKLMEDYTLDDGDGRKYRLSPINSQHYSPTRTKTIAYRGRSYHPGKDRQWTIDPERIPALLDLGLLTIRGNSLFQKLYLDYAPGVALDNLWTDTARGSFGETNIYVVQTTIKPVQRCLLMTTDPGDLVLDPTCGSGTTGYVAEQWGRRWITIDTSRVALALARTRLMAARYPYYILADSPEGLKKEGELTGQPMPSHRTDGEIKKGFVYESAPHITLKAIANNEEIDTIHGKWQPQLDDLRGRINKALGTKWEEWEVPRKLSADDADDADSGRGKKNEKQTPSAKSAKSADALLSEWWRLRRERQAEIDASIARRADTELLYDRPYQDNKRVRVAGPFTVESLSPHRTISVEEKRADAEEGDPEIGLRIREFGPNQFGHVVIENLKAAGVQNSIKNERMKFDRLEPYAGQWIHAEGEYTEAEGTSRRVGVCIGPEHGTVSPDLIKEAAKEAVQGVGFDILVVCGFAFDPHVAEETTRYGKLVVLPARINADLQFGSEYLKKTGAANLFTVFGEPDIDVNPADDGKIVVEINGVDVYDPTTGQIRSNTTDDIACWFIDTNYNGESFFVRHAYFTGADQPYDKLKRALRAEIDEAAWATLYSTTSRPFDPPTTGKIAIKVINHYGDEVLKVYEV